MRYIKSSNEGFVFHLGHREKELLFAVLNLFPLLPPAHQKLSRHNTETQNADHQALLEEALAEHRAENQRKLKALLSDPARWRAHSEHGSDWCLTLNSSELEWFLQVLNDIRVGSWVLLGSPEEKLPPLTRDNARMAWVMEVSGAFQIALLEALQGRRDR